MAKKEVAMAKSILAIFSDMMAISVAPAPSPPNSSGIKMRWRATSGLSMKRMSSMGNSPVRSISSLVSKESLSLSSLERVSRTMLRISGSILPC